MLGRRMLAILFVVELVLIAVVLLWKRLDGLDLDVYRLGTQAFFAKGDPYGVLPPTRDGTLLPFIYPPFAALAFAPLLAVPLQTALVALTVISVLALGAALALCFARFDRRLQVVGPAVLAAQTVALFSEPVRATLGFGQVNLLLMLLVTVDVLAPLKRRGYLVGLAAAMKLTPLAFILYFLVRKDLRSAARAAGTFAVCALGAWVVAPDASVRYWTTLAFQGVGISDPGYIGNQSLRGLLARLELGQAWWLVAVVLVLAATAFAIHRAKHPVPAFLACALGALLISPLSWTHHWVWSAPVIGVLCWQAFLALCRRSVSLGNRDARCVGEDPTSSGGFAPHNRLRRFTRLGRWWAAVPATIVFVVSPVWDFQFWPLRESYVLTGLALLVLLGQPLHDELDAADQRRDVARLDGGEHADA